MRDSNNLEDMERSWRSFWEAEKINIQYENKFFNLFSSTIGKLLDSDVQKIDTARWLLDDFDSFIDKRSINILKKYIPKTLKWHLFVWEKEDSDYGELLMTFPDTIEKIKKRTLKEGRIYYLIDGFVSHIKEHKEYFDKEHKEYFTEKKQRGEYHYSDTVMSDFFDTLVKSSEDNENRWIWRGFPDSGIWKSFPYEWQITTKNIEKPKNYIPKTLCNNFIRWKNIKIFDSTEYDKTLNDIVDLLFPSVCPIMWAYVLTFMMSGLRDKRMKSLIERPLIFSSTRRATAGWMGNDEDVERKGREDMERQSQAEEKETISLALLLFGVNFTKDSLENYIDELKKLERKYNDEVIEIRRIEYIRIFKMLQKALSKPKQPEEK